MTQRLKEAREAQGLSQLQLAIRAETIPGVIARIEQRRGTPSWEIGLRIARALGHDVVALEALFAQDGES